MQKPGRDLMWDKAGIVKVRNVFLVTDAVIRSKDILRLISTRMMFGTETELNPKPFVRVVTLHHCNTVGASLADVMVTVFLC